MKTLLLNPPSFENFDGGAGARYPARREVTTFWYPTWLAYPAGLIRDSRLLDAPAHGISPEAAIRIARDFDFAVIFTSTPGFRNDILLAKMLKDARPDMKIAFVGPHVTVLPAESLKAAPAIDFVARREFDFSVAEFAGGKSLEQIAGISFRKNGCIAHNPDRPYLEDLDSLPFVVEIFKRDLEYERYSIPFLLHPYVSFYTSRGCPAQCTFCLWPQTMSGHRWRTRSGGNVLAEVRKAREMFPRAREIFFDDDTFTWNKDRVLEICRLIKPLKLRWSCNARVNTDLETLRGMKEAGCRLLVVGFESGDPQVLKNIKKGATVEQALAFMKNCRSVGLEVHGDFQIGHPGDTPETIERTIRHAMHLDPNTIQVSVSHPYPGTRFFNYLNDNGYIVSGIMTNERGYQLPNIKYPGLSPEDIIRSIADFYGRFYFRPRVILRILKKAVFTPGERKRLYNEAREFFQFRAQSREFLKPG